ncbi:MAG TPA: glycosyltransferase family 39 protein [Blastocatellia bacterium]|nr:glycosyltransferase family 39 protein [Blastocatellia bacterium]
MDLPLRLLRGESLYRDIHYLYPPLSPHLNSQLYRLFGVHLDVLHVIGIICSALIVALCYRIARRLLAPSEATIATIAVIILCIFKPTGNLISPYTFAALYATTFSLGVLLLTLRYVAPGKVADPPALSGGFEGNYGDSGFSLEGEPPAVGSRASLIGAGVLIGLAAITKQEFALAGALTVTVALIYRYRHDYGRLVRELSFAAVPAMLIALPVYGLLFYRLGWQTLVVDCHLFFTHLPASLVYYNSQRTGLDYPLFSLIQMMGAALVGVAAISAIVLLSDRKRVMFKPASVVLIAALIVTTVIIIAAGRQWDGSPLRALPLLLITFIVCGWSIPKGGMEERAAAAARFIISVYSLAVLARVSLRVPSGGAFGGFFLPTSLVLFCYLFLRFLPQVLGRWTRDALTAGRARQIGQGLLIVMLVAIAVVFSVRYRKNYSYELSEQRGRLYASKVVGAALGEALDFIEKETQPDDPIAVLPEGSDLAFLTGRRMPLRHQIMIPGLMSERDEREVIEKLQQQHVRYVLIINRPMREFGLEAFGRDFYTTLSDWIDDHYQVVKVCGEQQDPDPEIGAQNFFVKILKLKE